MRGGALATLLALGIVSCGAAGRRDVEPGPLALAPPARAPVAPPPAPPVRPQSVALWVHVDQPDVLLDVLGVSSSSTWSEVARYAELVDTRQPVDVMLVARGDKIHDIEPAVRVHFKDPKALFALVSTEFRLREEGDRVFASSRRTSSDVDSPNKDDEWECDFLRGSDAAVCGSPKAVEAVADWSKPGPVPPPAVARAPIIRVHAYGQALLPLVGDIFGGTRIGGSGNGGLATFLADAERFSIEVASDGDQLHATALWRLRSQASRPARDLLSPPSTAIMPEVFHRVVRESGTAVFLPGGAAMPRWIAEILRQSQPLGRATARADGTPDPPGILGSFVAAPAVIGWGVRLDRARTALGAARVAKDQEKALRALDDALEPQLVYALTAPLASVERAMRGLAAQSPPRPTVSPGSAPVYTVRPASARLGLPKRSFVLEERSIDWMKRAGAPSGAAGPPQIRALYTLFASAFDGVVGVTCPVEELCADAYRRLTGTAASPPAESDIFQRPGVLAAGWASSSIGVQPVNRIMLKTATAPVSPDVLANIERDLLVPRFKLPFVITTTTEGAGGTVSAEMRGSRDAFRAALDQGLLGNSWGIARVLMMLFGGP